jgi:hypothetical protein
MCERFWEEQILFVFLLVVGYLLDIGPGTRRLQSGGFFSLISRSVANASADDASAISLLRKHNPSAFALPFLPVPLTLAKGTGKAQSITHGRHCARLSFN